VVVYLTHDPIGRKPEGEPGAGAPVLEGVGHDLGDGDEELLGADHDVLGAGGGGGQGVGVAAAAQVVDAAQLGPGQGQAPRHRPGGQQQPLVADALAGGELEPTAGRVDRADRGGGAQLDVVGDVEPFLVHVEVVAVGLATQVGLGQRRALVGLLGLLAEQQQAAVEALGT
jgi:hypothetical protein